MKERSLKNPGCKKKNFKSWEKSLLLLKIERWEKKEAHTLWGAHLGSLGRAEAAPGEADTWSSLQSKTIAEKEKVEAQGLKEAGKERGWNATE